MESQRCTTWPDPEVLTQRIDFLSLATIAEMRQIPFIPFPADNHPKAVEFAMIVRNEFTKRLKSELLVLPQDAEPAAVRIKFYKVLRSLRNEIAWMADSGDGWLEGQLEHALQDTSLPNSVYYWADRYLDSMLISIGA